MHSMLRNAIVSVAVAASAASTSVWAQAADPGMGTWKLNPGKSKFSPGPAPKDLTTTFEPSGKAVKWRAQRTGPDGKPQTAEFTGYYDGKEYKIAGSPTADAVILRRIDAMTTERVNKKDGRIVTTERRVVAKDGKSYTTTVKGTNANGTPVDHRMVFERQ